MRPRHTAARAVLALPEVVCHADQAPALVRWARATGVDLGPGLRSEIDDGFGGPAGDDRFDAAVGLFGMLNVVLGKRPAFEPDDAGVRRIEGWMLGLAGPSTPVSLAGSGC